LAAAQAAGMVSEEHTNVIIKSLEKLPPGLVEVHDAAERTLVQLAGQARPQEVARAGAHYLAHYDPDGVLADEREQDRRRGVTLTALDDGLWRLTGTCGAQLAAVLGARSAPRPADKDGLDPRSHVQRTHDALDELAGIVVRRKELSKSGAPATVIITMTEDQYLARKGLVETSSGQLLTVQSALELADEAILVGLVQAANGAVLKLGLSQRIATRRQTWALAARDKGCSIPDCDEPPERCQRHHVIPWCLGGPTDISNLTLLCRYHHRMFGKLGWRCLMLDGLPHWIKPPWQDPTQAPLLHHRIRPGV
jgi:hypothetical protein